MLPDGDQISDEASADVQGSEGAFLDAKSSQTNMEAGFVPIRVRLSDEGDDEDCEASLATSESFDCASERMATLSKTGSVSPSESFKEFFASSKVPSITLDGALRQLNELNSGVSSLDISLLENTSEEGFRFRMMEIAISNGLSLDDEVVHDILNALLPVIRENSKHNNPVKEAGDHIGHMIVAKPMADDDDDSTDGLYDLDMKGFVEASDLEQSENGEFLPCSAQGLPVRVSDDDDSEDLKYNNFSTSFELPVSSQMPNLEMEVQHGTAPDDEMESHNRMYFKHTVQDLLRIPEIPYLMQYVAQTSGNQDKSLGKIDCMKYRDDAQSCGLTEADANADSSLHELQKLKNKAKSMRMFKKRETESIFFSQSTTAPATGMSFLGNTRPFLPAPSSGLGPSIYYASHAVPQNSGASVSSPLMTRKGSKNDLVEGMDDTAKKLQMIGVKFLRLNHRLEQSAHNVVVTQVLHRLELAQKLRCEHMSRNLSLENLMLQAEEQEEAGQSDLNFECTILVLGKSGVGKSATVNSLFDEAKSGTDAYKPATKKVKEIMGTVNGIKLRIIDTPGLLPSYADRRYNVKIMSSVKHYIKKSPPDIMLYFDRLDMQCGDHGDMLLLRNITDTLGAAIWYNAIVVLTHGSSTPPDGANGVPISYELFVAQRFHVVQQTIRKAAGDMQLLNPVSTVENHIACPLNKVEQHFLPDTQVWKRQMLLLCFASKILAEVNMLMKLQISSPGKSFWVHPQVPPLPFLLSKMLKYRAELKLLNEQVDDEEVSDSDAEADSDGQGDYDDLPPFRRLTRNELRFLGKEQRRLYHEELVYRENLFMKKQLKDESVRKKELKRRLAAPPKEALDLIEEQLEGATPAAAPTTMPDLVLPPSFDADNASHRYRFLDTANPWLACPVLHAHGWDHDSGHDGLTLEIFFVIPKKVPVSVSGQIIKDKKEAIVQIECAASFKNGDGKSTQAGLDIQTLGKNVLYTIRSETKFSNFKKNKTSCGLAITMLEDTVAAGMKLEDCLLVGKRFKLVMNGGALMGEKDVAYGGSMEASLKNKDHPVGHSLSTLGLSIINWHGDIAIDSNLQLQFSLGKTMIIVRANLNNKKAGHLSFQACSLEQLRMAFIGLIPLLCAFINNKNGL